VSLFVTVAVKLFARTGVWPAWFVRVVGEPVPGAYVALALDHRGRLERELGTALPRPMPPRTGAANGMMQVEFPGVATATARPRRSA
jgi:hypothetical protein